LDDLGSCDPFFPPDSNTTGCLEVVPVHDYMDCQVECDRNITLQLSDMELVRGLYDRSVADELCEAENSGGTMVVDMKKLQGFLLEEQKHSID